MFSHQVNRKDADKVFTVVHNVNGDVINFEEHFFGNISFPVSIISCASAYVNLLLL